MIDEKKLVQELGQHLARWGYAEPYSTGIRAGIRMAMDAVKEQPILGGWIPCSERLPDESGYYLTTIQDGEVCYVSKNWFAHTGDYYLGKSEWRELCDGEEVIAWMPLPEPYRVEG